MIMVIEKKKTVYRVGGDFGINVSYTAVVLNSLFRTAIQISPNKSFETRIVSLCTRLVVSKKKKKNPKRKIIFQRI